MDRYQPMPWFDLSERIRQHHRLATQALTQLREHAVHVGADPIHLDAAAADDGRTQ